MKATDEFDIAEMSRRLYHERLQTSLERDHMDEFVAIEPISGEYFIGRTLSESIGAARDKYPDRLAHALRVGHKAAVQFGFISPAR